MTDTIKEQLSAFLDGELPEAETTLLLKRLERDEELKGTLSRYSLIGAALRTDGNFAAAQHVAARVNAVLAAEPAFSRTAVRWAPSAGWLKPLAGLGVAASVAAATLVLMPQWDSELGAPVAQVASSATEVPSVPMVATLEAPVVDQPAPSYTTPPAPAGGGPLAGAQFAAYLVAHSEFTSPLARRTVIVAPPVEAPAGQQGEGQTPAATVPPAEAQAPTAAAAPTAEAGKAR
jgi:sigma-E factor negative regulatory protein RseA